MVVGITQKDNSTSGLKVLGFRVRVLGFRV